MREVEAEFADFGGDLGCGVWGGDFLTGAGEGVFAF